MTQKVAKELASQRVGSWTMQKDVSGVLGRMVAGRILQSANFSDRRAQQKERSVAAKTRERKCLSRNRN